MRRAASPIATLAAGAMMATMVVGPALAAPHCTNSADRNMFEITALQSRLMVLATGCGDNEQYNAFMTRYHPTIEQTNHDLMAYFRRHYGRAAQREYDAYITSLANGESDIGIAEGSEFCPHDKLIFHEVMSLPSSADLPSYAAGKDVVPSTLGSCIASDRPEFHRSAVRHVAYHHERVAYHHEVVHRPARKVKR